MKHLESGKLYRVSGPIVLASQPTLNLLGRVPCKREGSDITNFAFNWGDDRGGLWWRKILCTIPLHDTVLFVQTLEDGYHLVIYKDTIGVLWCNVEFY